VEVAIALAVIGFALVAIIGILPAGLNVQKENREETIINQEVSIWMDAIRQGAEGMNYLTNYVDGIEIVRTELDADGIPLTNNSLRSTFTSLASRPPGFELVDGFSIIGLLTTPTFDTQGGVVYSNHVVAYVRAISGAAPEKAPQDNTTVREGAFAYRLTCSMVPFYAYDDRFFDYTEFRALTAPGAGVLETNELAYARATSRHLHELRLLFQWPLRPPLDGAFAPPLATRPGNGRQTFRTMISGGITNVTTGLDVPPRAYSFVQPGTFKKPRNLQ
jgi:hypothetical protein